MDITGLLSAKRLICLLCFILINILIITGCKETLIKYDYFIEKPFATKKGDSIEVNLGYTRASASWIRASAKIEGNTIYISGELTFKEIPQTLSIKLPNPGKSYQIFWVDGDGKKNEIIVH